jgi:hypothetical protein
MLPLAVSDTRMPATIKGDEPPTWCRLSGAVAL